MTGNPRVLVTGASGFIGRALLEALIREPGAVVTGTTRSETPLPAGVRSRRIDRVDARTDWREALNACDTVVHLAARVHRMDDGVADPLAEYREVNVAGTLALAQQASAAGAKRFIFVSSVKVNGENTRPGQVFNETDAPLPADPYGVSKAEAEAGLLAGGWPGAMEIVVIRPPLVYGPGVRANFLRMSQWLARGIPLPLGSIRDNRRSLLGIDNLVSLLRVCMHHPAAANQVFLAGDGEDLSTTELLRRTAAALGVHARLIPVPVPLLAAGARLVGRPHLLQRLCGNLQVNISKAHRVLGWVPPLTLDEGLRRAVQPLRAPVAG